MSEAAHQDLPHGVEIPESAVPHREHIIARGDRMQCFVPPVDNVDDSEPSVFVLIRKLELLAVVPSIYARPDFLDVFDGDCAMLVERVNEERNHTLKPDFFESHST